MRTARWLAAAVVCGLAPHAAADEVVTIEAPRALRAEFDRLRSANPFAVAVAAARLGANDRHGPFLRFERMAAFTDAHRTAFDAALAPIEARAWARHAGRTAGWAKDRRLDLLCEYLATCPPADAAAVIGPLLKVQQDIHKEAWPDEKLAGREMSGFIPAGSLADLARWPGVDRPGRPFVPRPGTRVEHDGWTFNGRRFPSSPGDKGDGFGTVIASRGVLLRAGAVADENWGHYVVLANGPAEVRFIRNSLLVVDGDVELAARADMWRTVVIATGSIRSAVVDNRPAGGAVGKSLLHAPNGSINLPSVRVGEKVFAQAGGTVTFMPGERPIPFGAEVREGATLVPYGIRFVGPDAFGFRAAPAAGGVAVTAVEEWSPLARYGVRVGDVIVRVGFQNIRTADALRRALRQALFADAAVFHLTRGDERLTRVVYLDGLPARP